MMNVTITGNIERKFKHFEKVLEFVFIYRGS